MAERANEISWIVGRVCFFIYRFEYGDGTLRFVSEDVRPTCAAICELRHQTCFQPLLHFFNRVFKVWWTLHCSEHLNGIGWLVCIQLIHLQGGQLQLDYLAEVLCIVKLLASCQI